MRNNPNIILEKLGKITFGAHLDNPTCWNYIPALNGLNRVRWFQHSKCLDIKNTRVWKRLNNMLNTLEENLSISTGLATRPSRLAPKKCINKSIWLATGGHLPWVHHGYLPGANQIDLFMHFPTHKSRWPRLKWTSFLLVIYVNRLRSK